MTTRRKQIHDTVTGQFVSKARAEADPGGTVAITAHFDSDQDVTPAAGDPTARRFIPYVDPSPFLRRLAMASEEPGTEEAHQMADGAFRDLLTELGYTDVVTAWDAVEPKWYA